VFVQVHTRIGRSILDNLGSELSGKINSTAYLAGCILPDMFPALPPHDKSQSLPYVADLINRIKEEIHGVNGVRDWKSAIKLGMVSHYICDFFCLAHNSEACFNKANHFIYEYKMQMIYNNAKLKEVLNNQGFMDSIINNYQSGSATDFINYAYGLYSREKQGMNNDIKYSLAVASAILRNFLQSRMHIRKSA
jgi:hypothetical protein